MANSIINSPNQKSLEARARRAAKRVGLRAKKTRWRKGTCDNHGLFQVVDLYSRFPQAGYRYDLTAEEVIEFCSTVQT